jgi:hypothetical protein
MNVFSISDLHLSFSCPEKDMSVFGPKWMQYQEKIKDHWQSIVGPNDLVLIAGDISWALKLEQALIDLEFIHALNGIKLLSKGNHDYWWPSLAKLKRALPSSIYAIHHNAIDFGNISVCATTLHDCKDFNFDSVVQINPTTFKPQDMVKKEKIYLREINRLELALKQLNQNAKTKIAMVHYPPINLQLEENKVTQLLEQFGINDCVFGHLHNVTKKNLFGAKNGIEYLLTSCDYLDFKPTQLSI